MMGTITSAVDPSFYTERALKLQNGAKQIILALNGNSIPSIEVVKDVVFKHLIPLLTALQELPSSPPLINQVKVVCSFSLKLLCQNLAMKTYFFQKGLVSAEKVFPFKLLPATVHFAYQLACLQKPILGEEKKISTSKGPLTPFKILNHDPFSNICKPIDNPTELPIHYYLSGLPHVLPVSWSTNETLATPLCDCDFYEATNEGKLYLSPLDCLSIVKQIFIALSYIHGAGIVHCDIKEENILLKRDPITKAITAYLGDFGASALIGTLPSSKATIHFMAPETLSHPLIGPTPPLTAHPSRDIWALGLILWSCTHEEEFIGTFHDSKKIAISKILNLTPQEIVGKIDLATPDYNLRDLLKQMLELDPEKRITAQQALAHPFLLTKQG